MRTLAFLCISLSLAAMAQGNIGFVPSKTVVQTGETINIKLIADGACYGYSIDAATDWGKGGTASNLQIAPIFTIASPGYIENSEGILFSAVGAYASTSPAAVGTTLFSFNYTADSILGLVTIEPAPAGEPYHTLQDPGTWYTAGASTGDVGGVTQLITGCTITVVPEPMTLALLSLGGLWLRKR
jgi:hypothetical protein